MIIESVRVQNFRCIQDGILNCRRLTVLVGPNGCGKSSFLRALELFYDVDARFSEDDCYEREEPILVTVTYEDLSPDEKALFGSYVENDALVVEKEMLCGQGQRSQKYFGFKLQNPDFAELRAIPVWTDWRAGYAALRETGGYEELPAAVRGREHGEGILREWEDAHRERLIKLRKEEQFFGARNVGGGRLDNRTKFVLIPAVLDASDIGTEKGKNTTISQLLDLVVRSELRTCEDVRQFEEETQTRYLEIMQRKTEVQLRDLESRLGQTLATYAPGTDVEMTWETGEIRIPMPTADTRLREDEHASTIERCGHGAQRALILTLLQHLAVSATQSAGERAEEDQEGNGLAEAGCSLILGIEEPELYQHPDRQRLIARVLLQLSDGSIAGVADTTQVIYTTHSPLFTGIDRADQIRVLRKQARTVGEGKSTQVSEVDLEDIVHTLETAHNVPQGTFSVAGLKARLAAVMTPWVNEGFFARVAVLTEGESDRAALLGAAQASGCDFEGKGISVLPCGGKYNLDRPAAIFSTLGIATYVIWDGDRGQGNEGQQRDSAKMNGTLLRLLGRDPNPWPRGVWDNGACFEYELERALREEIGAELFDELVGRCRSELGYDSNDRALKSPHVVRSVLCEAEKRGKPARMMRELVERIVASS